MGEDRGQELSAEDKTKLADVAALEGAKKEDVVLV